MRTVNNSDHSIDIRTETVLALADVPDHLPRRRGGRRVAAATVHRWARKGLRGLKLEVIQVAGTRCTSVEALQRFFDRLTESFGSDCAVIPRRNLGSRLRHAEAMLEGTPPGDAQ